MMDSCKKRKTVADYEDVIKLEKSLLGVLPTKEENNYSKP